MSNDIEYIEAPPELLERLRFQNELDRAEAEPKAPVSGFVYKGIRLESRWSVLRELNVMTRVVDAMPELLARRIEVIWCDSKATSNYIVTAKDGPWASELRWAIEAALLQVNGGHNGVRFEGLTGVGLLDAHWAMDDMNYL